MFIAKIKTATVVLCGVAALGLGTGGVVYQTRAGAADSQKVERGTQERPKRAAEADQEKDKWRRIAEEAQARERALRDELKKLNLLVQKLQEKLTDGQKETERAQAMQNAAEQARAREAKNNARDPAVPLGRRQPPQPEANRSADRKPDLRVALEKLEAERDLVLRKHKELSEQMQKQLAELEQRNAQIDLEMKKIQLVLAANQPNPNASQKPASGDKLDQILERLERLEKRLDRLEGRKLEPNKP